MTLDDEIKAMIRSDFESFFTPKEPAAILTVADLRAAMEKMRQAGAAEPHTHMVHPSLVNGRRWAETVEDLHNPEIKWGRCGVCGGAIATVPA